MEIRVRAIAHIDIDATLSVYRAAVSSVGEGFYNTALRHEWAGRTEAEFVQQAEARSRLVAESDGRILGYVGYDKNRQTLTECYIHPSWQGQGVGRRLVEHVYQLADNDGLDHLTVLASANARSFYERLGFVFEGPEGLLMGDGQILPCCRMHVHIPVATKSTPQ